MTEGRAFDPRASRSWPAAAVAGLAASLVLWACAGTGGPAAPAGSTYVGWRLYQARCAGCHGVDATGPAKVPGLLDHVREMGAARFANLVLTRYDWPAAEPDARDDAAARTALVEDILRRRESAFAMPAWQDEPPVRAHVLDLYAYLSARADGALGPGRPPRRP